MPIDDYTLKQAVDAVSSSLRRYKDEPTDTNRDQFVDVCRHYTNVGVSIKLRPDGVVVQRKEITNV